MIGAAFFRALRVQNYACHDVLNNYFIQVLPAPRECRRRGRPYLKGILWFDHLK